MNLLAKRKSPWRSVSAIDSDGIRKGWITKKRIRSTTAITFAHPSNSARHVDFFLAIATQDRNSFLLCQDEFMRYSSRPAVLTRLVETKKAPKNGTAMRKQVKKSRAEPVLPVLLSQEIGERCRIRKRQRMGRRILSLGSFDRNVDVEF